jgi:hypothetical protein
VYVTRNHTKQRFSPPEVSGAHNYRMPADTRRGIQPNTDIRGTDTTGVTVVAEVYSNKYNKQQPDDTMESATTAQSIADMDLPSPRVQASSQTQMDYPKAISDTIYSEYCITSTTASRGTRRPAQ